MRVVKANTTMRFSVALITLAVVSGIATVILLLLLRRPTDSNGPNRITTQGSIKAISCQGNRCELNVSKLGEIASADLIEMQLKPNGVTRYFEALKSNTRSLNDPEWYGEDVHSIAAVNLMQESDGSLFGSVVDGNEVYQICTLANGKTEAIVTASADFPREGPAVQLPNGNEFDMWKRSLKNSSLSNLRGSRSAGHRSLYDDLGGNLDIMVVWTKAAECMASGSDSRGCKLNPRTKKVMVGMIKLAVEETNKAYELSGVQTRLRLVHAFRHDEYEESESYTFSNALQHITSRDDGVMDDVHQKRALYGADLVAMVIDDASACGLAWEGPNKDFMFSITSWRCVNGHFSFAHEIGHNLGCGHDTGTTDSCGHGNPDNDYSYGFRDPQGEFRSIMAYECKTGQCDNVQKTTPCTRLQRLSNPYSRIDGRPIGHRTADNARQINDVRQMIAGYFPVAEQCYSDVDCQTKGPCMKCGDGWPGVRICVHSQECAAGGLAEPEATVAPTDTPTTGPTPGPTTFSPTVTYSPSSSPTFSPTTSPSSAPTLSPTLSPSSFPSLSPTLSSSPTRTSSMAPSTTFQPTLSSQPSSSVKPSSSLQPTRSFQPTTEAPTTYGCQDDPDWRYEDPRTGEVFGCSWVALQPQFYCRKIGVDGTSSLMACRVSCDTCPL